MVNQCLLRIRDDYIELIHYYRTKDNPIPRTDVAILLSIAAVLALIAMLSYLTGGYHIGFAEINSVTPYIPEYVLHNLTVFGDGALLLPIILLFFTRNVQVQWTILFAAITCALASDFLKDYFHLARPAGVLAADLIHSVGPVYKTRSFPSGHALTSFAMASICFCYVRTRALKYFFVVVAGMTALSRILLGVHWPIDVLAGGALGILIGAGSVMITLKWRVGLRAQGHLFTLVILVLSCFVVFVDSNDYNFALPLLYAVAVAAMIQVLRRFVFDRSKPFA